MLTPQFHTNIDYIELLDLYTDTKKTIIDWHQCISQEIEHEIFHAGNMSFGADEILSIINKKAWPTVENEITQLFPICLEESYHRLVFKTAIFYALPKHEKQNQSLP